MNKKDGVYDLLVHRLINARYTFGQQILVKELSIETGVSRQPIMTALGRLAADGFVRIVPQVGCQVVDPDWQAIADFYLMFERLEGLLAELAAKRRTDEQLAELINIQRRIETFEASRSTSLEEYAALNRDFHQAIHTMARSPLVDEKQRSNFNMSDFFINQSVGFNSFLSEAVRDHQEIIDAIAARASKRARLLNEKHIATVREAVLTGAKTLKATESTAGKGRGGSTGRSAA